MAEGLPRAESMIRASSGTTKAAATVLPELAEGAAPWHGPAGLLPGVSAVDLNHRLQKAARYDDIKKVAKQALESPSPRGHPGLRRRPGCLLQL